MAANFTMEELLKAIESLPFHQFKEVVNHYSTTKNTDFQTEMDSMVTASLQQRLISLGINSTCPNCGSEQVMKFGKRKDIQIFKCKSCGKRFTPFTGTILEKSRWHWDIWIKVLEMTINGYSIQAMVNVLQDDYGCDGINPKTVWLWRMKLIHALASIPQPVLTGVIQVDETFVRESQKGSRALESYLVNDVRHPRYGYKPSKFGVMGPEFATIVTAVDNRGYCVCKVSSMGRLTKELFLDLFEEHFDTPAYICSDANDVYDNYCNLFDIPHYEKPSNYLATIEKHGYKYPSDSADLDDVKAVKEHNKKLLEKLYSEGVIDRITNRGYVPYEKFTELKSTYGLSLGRVNELHSDIKRFINGQMTNVSTKYLKDYIGFFSYIRNWRVKNGKYPNSKKDTEEIFIEILKTKVNYTVADVEAQEVELPKPSGRYICLLKEETEKARKVTSNKYFKFGAEDGVKTFNKREYLLDLPESKLYGVAKELKIKRYKSISKWTLVSTIMKQPNFNEILYQLLANDRHYTIDQEDLDAIRTWRYIS